MIDARANDPSRRCGAWLGDRGLRHFGGSRWRNYDRKPLHAVSVSPRRYSCTRARAKQLGIQNPAQPYGYGSYPRYGRMPALSQRVSHEKEGRNSARQALPTKINLTCAPGT